MKKYWLCLLISIHAHLAHAEVSNEVIKVIAKNEPNSYYASQVKDKNWNFLASSNYINPPFTAILGVAGGVNLGVTYIVSSDGHTVHRLNIGPLDGILTAKALPFLKRNEVFLIAPNNSGTGVLTISGFLIRIEEKAARLLLTIPLWGELWRGSLDDSQLCFRTDIVGLERDGKQGLTTLKMRVHTSFEGILPSPQTQAEILKKFRLPKTEELFSLVIDQHNKVTPHSAAALQDFLRNTLQIDQTLDVKRWEIQTFLVPSQQTLR